MSVPFYWFKDISVKQVSEIGRFFDGECIVEMINGNSTSHSSGNISPIQEGLLGITNGEINIPYIPMGWVDGDARDIETKILLDLIPPQKMGNLLGQLEQTERVKWMKHLSDDGYYIAYDNC